MNTHEEVRADICNRLGEIVLKMNSALMGGEALEELRPSIETLGRGGKLPHWYATLKANAELPNLDGKSLGSVIEMVFVAVLESHFYSESSLVPFCINPAKGVDIPALRLGVKSPSKNYCTSEPFFSAYERLLGNEYDAVILLTDYQDAKKHPPLRVQIIEGKYLRGSELADKGLCAIAKKCRSRFVDDHVPELKKIVRFLAHINQQDKEAKSILKLLAGELSDEQVDVTVSSMVKNFGRQNEKMISSNKEPDSMEFVLRLASIRDTSPRWMSVINAADNWVIENHKDFGRYPNENEWGRFIESDLDGKIGLSLALQWRYNFGSVFKCNK